MYPVDSGRDLSACSAEQPVIAVSSNVRPSRRAAPRPLAPPARGGGKSSFGLFQSSVGKTTARLTVSDLTLNNMARRLSSDRVAQFWYETLPAQFSPSTIAVAGEGCRPAVFCACRADPDAPQRASARAPRLK